jgi:endonuclease YncB( thermonuclease family)
LARLVEGRDLSCRVQGRDSFGRPPGTCQANGEEVNAALVATGWALSENNAELASLESAARSGQRGLWSYLPGAPEGWQQR